MDFTNHIAIELPEGYTCNVDESFNHKSNGDSFHDLFKLNVDMNAAMLDYQLNKLDVNFSSASDPLARAGRWCNEGNVCRYLLNKFVTIQ